MEALHAVTSSYSQSMHSSYLSNHLVQSLACRTYLTAVQIVLPKALLEVLQSADLCVCVEVTFCQQALCKHTPTPQFANVRHKLLSFASSHYLKSVHPVFTKKHASSFLA